jgi:hypothetical protein
MKAKPEQSRTKRNKAVINKKTPILHKSKKTWAAKAMIHQGV